MKERNGRRYLITYSPKERRHFMKKQIVTRVLIGAALVVAVILFLIFQSASESSFLSQYYLEHGKYQVQKLSGPFSIQIDLTNLDSNSGNALYQDGNCTIYVDKVYYHDVTMDDSILFRATSNYSLTGVRQLTTYDPYDEDGDIQYMPTFYWEDQDGSKTSFPAQLRGDGLDGESIMFFLPNEFGETISLPDVITLEFPYICVRTWSAF